MRLYEDLTVLGKLRRIRQMARMALKAFGFPNAHLKFIVDSGNTLYRVKVQAPLSTEGNLYVDNCYLLRIHWPGYQRDGAIDSELSWLDALSQADIPVPQPIATTEGKLSVVISTPGVPTARRCSLLRWVKGRMAVKHVSSRHLKAIGSLMAQLQNHVSRWRRPSGFVRRHYDSNGLWGDDTGTNITADEVCPRIPRRYFAAFKEVTQRVEHVMDDWGKGSDVYGLIHADLGTKANVLFHCGEARPIDFDDAGFGYWVYDLALPLADWEGEAVWPAFRNALIEGYTETRPLPEEQLKHLELFQAAYRAVEIFWGTACTMRSPHSTYWVERQNTAWRHIKRYLKANPQK